MHAGAVAISLDAPTAPDRRPLVALVVILAVAAALRLPGLDAVPPGLNQDEAANAWNAWCLLKTGHDQTGAPWPIFYYRALGENRSALFLYFLLPFQAVGGLNIWTTRLPAACAGLATIALIYWVVRRLFDRPTGLAAAALLAINPAHIQLSRWGHEGCVIPLLTLAPLALLLWAGLPLSDRPAKPRPWRALIAGLLAGICCYGYPAVRLFLPVYLCGALAVTAPGWWRLLHTAAGRRTLLTLSLGVAATFGPLAYMHLTDEAIGKRGSMTWLWQPDDPLATRAAKVIDRYQQHFATEFLFEHGDADAIAWTPGFGLLPWYVLPLQLLGLVLLLPRLHRQRAARLLFIGVLLYPAADLLNWHTSLHALRSSAGLIVLILPAAVAVAMPLSYAATRRLRAVLLAYVVLLAGLILPEQARFLHASFVDRRTQHEVFVGNAVPLRAACAWLRPRLADVDAVICTTLDMNQPYVITLVTLAHDPQQWFSELREYRNDGKWDVYTRYGRFHFMPEHERTALLDTFAANDRPDRLVLFLNPAEPLATATLAATIMGPDNRPALLIYDIIR